MRARAKENGAELQSVPLLYENGKCVKRGVKPEAKRHAVAPTRTLTRRKASSLLRLRPPSHPSSSRACWRRAPPAELGLVTGSS
jgi:hypothetical protein